MATYSEVYLGHFATVQGDIWRFGGSKLKNICDPTDAQDVTTKSYVDTQVTNATNLVSSSLSDAVSSLTNDYETADANLSSTLSALISTQQSRIDAILASADTTDDSLSKVAALATTLNASESASLTAATASLQSQITALSTSVTTNSIDCTGSIQAQWVQCPFFSNPVGSMTMNSQIFMNGSWDSVAEKWDPLYGIQNIKDGSDPQDVPSFHQIGDAVSVESLRALASEEAISTSLTSYQTSNDATVSAIQSDLASEAFARSTAVLTLQNSIAAETSRAETFESTCVVKTPTGLQTIQSNVSTQNLSCQDFNVSGIMTSNNRVNLNGAIVLGTGGNICFNNNQGPFLLGDGSGFRSWHDATHDDDVPSYKQLRLEVDRAKAAESALAARCLVLEGQMNAIYEYFFSTSPTVPPTR